MKKILFSLALTLMAQGALACTPGVAGSGPAGDPNCLQPYFEQERMMQGQSSSSSGGGSYYTSDAYARLGIVLDWGALAYNQTIGTFYTSNNNALEGFARNIALEKCGQKDCKILHVYKNSYLVVATGRKKDGTYLSIYVDDRNKEKAISMAMEQCKFREKLMDCKILFSESSLAR